MTYMVGNGYPGDLHGSSAGVRQQRYCYARTNTSAEDPAHLAS